jgi:hypothetical protein
MADYPPATTAPSDVRSVHEYLHQRFGEHITYFKPGGAGVVHTFHVDTASGMAAISWHPRHGFGLSGLDNDRGFGEGHDEVFADVDSLLARLEQVWAGDRIRPPIGVWLGGTRRTVGVTQAVTAARLDRSQASIAQIERRSDLLVSTLFDYARAIGAEAQIVFRTRAGTLVYPAETTENRPQREVEPRASNDTKPDTHEAVQPVPRARVKHHG